MARGMEQERARRNGGVKTIRGKSKRERGNVGLKDETKGKGAQREVRLQRVEVVNARRGIKLRDIPRWSVLFCCSAALVAQGEMPATTWRETANRGCRSMRKRREKPKSHDGQKSDVRGRARAHDGKQPRSCCVRKGKEAIKAQLPVETLKLAGGEWGGGGPKRGKGKSDR